MIRADSFYDTAERLGEDALIGEGPLLDSHYALRMSYLGDIRVRDNNHLHGLYIQDWLGELAAQCGSDCRPETIQIIGNILEDEIWKIKERQNV